MSKREEFNKKVITIKLVLILVVGIILGVSCIFSKQIENLLGIGDKESGFVSSEILQDSKLSVHYIDVGQGDSTLICLPDGKVMLIDVGESYAGDEVVNYLEALEIEVIDYFVLTHSDSDHSGGVKKVFEAFEIKTIYRPFQLSVDESGAPTAHENLSAYLADSSLDCNQVDTVVYANFLKYAYTETYTEGGDIKNADVWCFYDGLVIESTTQGEEYVIEFFAPLRVQGYSSFDYTATQTYGYPTKSYGNNTNNHSPVILLECAETSFVFTGDAEKNAERDFVNSLSTAEKDRFENVDVFQAGHHGSDTSNTEELLNLITPTYVVASCGENNKHGHPDEEVVGRIQNLPHSVNDYFLTTAESGNIVFAFKDDGTLAYTALKAGDMQVTIYWWHIAVGAFLAISIIIICVKVTTNKKATAKRIVSTTKRVSKKFRAK